MKNIKIESGEIFEITLMHPFKGKLTPMASTKISITLEGFEIPKDRTTICHPIIKINEHGSDIIKMP
jgi:hypothetical protein